jgi:hypothetical protein
MTNHQPFDRNTQPRRVRSLQRRHREAQAAWDESLEVLRGQRPLVRKSRRLADTDHVAIQRAISRSHYGRMYLDVIDDAIYL